MTPRALRWLTIILPVTFLTLLLLIRPLVIQSPLRWILEPLLFLIIVVGVIVFSSWVFRNVETRELAIKGRTEELRSLHEAALILTTELEMEVVLQKVVDLARDLLNARYGALGVLDLEKQEIAQFIVSGISPDERSQIGKPPVGKGLLGEMLKHGRPLRVADVGADPRSVGYHRNHPKMKSFIGVPIRSKGTVIGDLYLADKTDPQDPNTPIEFSEEDLHLLEMFATQAAISIENALLYRQTQQLAILEERERIGMDLHDGIIQSIYAIGLMLEDVEHRLRESKYEQGKQITKSILGLNDVIRDIRNYILDLRPERFQGRDLFGGLEELVRDLRANSFLTVEISKNGIQTAEINPSKTVEILHIVQEALTNIRKHARASRVSIMIEDQEKLLQLVIDDNGVGIPREMLLFPSGNGLKNMRERTFSLDGDIDFIRKRDGGTRIEIRVPID